MALSLFLVTLSNICLEDCKWDPKRGKGKKWEESEALLYPISFLMVIHARKLPFLAQAAKSGFYHLESPDQYPLLKAEFRILMVQVVCSR